MGCYRIINRVGFGEKGLCGWVSKSRRKLVWVFTGFHGGKIKNLSWVLGKLDCEEERREWGGGGGGRGRVVHGGGDDEVGRWLLAKTTHVRQFGVILYPN